MLITPIICIPLFGAAITLLFYKDREVQQWTSTVVIAIHTLYTFLLTLNVFGYGSLVEYVGNWDAPIGITLIADQLSVLMLIMTSVVMLAVNIYSRIATDAKLESQGYHSVVLILLAGLSGTFVTGDLFNLYVWFEVILMSSFVLLSIKGNKEQLEGGIKYVTLNLFASLLFLCAAGLIYGLLGTLNLADLSLKVAENISDPRIHTFALMLWIAFAIKAAIFPFYSWLPSSYHTPPIAVGAIFAGLLTKVGIYSMIRVFIFVFNPLPAWIYTLLVIISIITMMSGVLGAYVQSDFRRILAFSSVSQVGFMMLGIALQNEWAMAATILFMIHHGFVKSGLFITSGICGKSVGSFYMNRLGGFLDKSPLLGILFLTLAFSLIGVPFTSGFTVKIMLLKSCIMNKEWVAIFALLVVSFMTMLYMLKIWSEVFWKKLPLDEDGKVSKSKPLETGMFIPVVIVLIFSLMIGIFGNVLSEVAIDTAKKIYDRDEYIQKVLRLNLKEGLSYTGSEK